jgi:hypothetical protein
MWRTPVVVVASVSLTTPVLPPAHSAPGQPTTTPSTARSAADHDRAHRVRGWNVPLDERATTDVGQRVPGSRTFETVGVLWASGRAPTVEVRTRTMGSWTGWVQLDRLKDVGDGGHPVRATEPWWVGPSDAVRVRVTRGYRSGLEVVLVDPGQQDTDAPEEAARRTAMVSAARQSRAPAPRIFKRDAWGANERWRSGDPVVMNTIKQAHIHHTASSNSYSRADVPAILRSMYYYHTKELGWSDIGYNFLVDRFGRVWHGRAGGFKRPIRGAHTLGFNNASVGVAAIGNYEEKGPSRAMRRGIAHLTAWKLDKYGRNPTGRIRISSTGSDRYPRGKYRLPVIDGHRDTNYTACPGVRLYKRIPDLRRRIKNRVEKFN